MKSYRARCAFVFGGSQGIGLAVACELAARGADVHLFARRGEVLQRARAVVEARALDAVRVDYTEVDVTDGGRVCEVFNRAVSTSGAPDWVINCAGAARPDYFENIDERQFASTLTLNVLGVRNVAAAAMPHLMSNRGHLVNTASVAGFLGVFGYTDYAASKFAVVGFSQSLAQEWRPAGVAVSVLFPPDTETEGFAEEERTKPAETRAISAGNKRVKPEVVARAVVRALPGRRFAIYPGFDSKLAHWAVRWCPALVNAWLARTIRRVQSGRGGKVR